MRLVQAVGGLLGEGELGKVGGLQVLRGRGVSCELIEIDRGTGRLTNSATRFSSAASSSSSRFRLRPLDGFLNGRAPLGGRRTVGIVFGGSNSTK